MAGKSRVRAKRSLSPRSVATSHARAQPKSLTSDTATRQPLAASDDTATSAEVVAASVVSLMVLAARSGAPYRFDAGAQRNARAALTQVLAERFEEDN